MRVSLGNMLFKIGLFLLSITLFVAPVFYGLHVNGWDLRELVTPENDVQSMLSTQSPILSFSDVSVVEFSPSTSRFALRIELSIINKYDFSLTLTDLDFDVYCSDHNVFLGTGGIDGETTIDPHSWSDFSITFTASPWGAEDIFSNHIETHASPALTVLDVLLRIRNFELDALVRGITINLTLEEDRLITAHHEVGGVVL